MQINLDKEGPDSKYAGIKKISVQEIIQNCVGRSEMAALRSQLGSSARRSQPCVEDIWDDFDDDGNGLYYNWSDLN